MAAMAAHGVVAAGLVKRQQYLAAHCCTQVKLEALVVRPLMEMQTLRGSPRERDLEQ